MPQGTSSEVVGVIGAGKFGTTIAQLLSYNAHVLLYARRHEVVERINHEHQHLGYTLSPNIRATARLAEVAERCRLLFPIVPSQYFRQMMRALADYLTPDHFVIHGTKGLDIPLQRGKDIFDQEISRHDVRTMSEVIREETVVRRIGCLGGPNLAREIMDGQPAATVLASPFDEVFEEGHRLLSSEQFFVFQSYDIIGTEWAGALKNVIAIGSGLLAGSGYGKNVQALLITRGLREMIYIGKAMGASAKSFLGTAGIGDLVATATSTDSRNYSLGYQIAQGKSLEEVLATTTEVAEGVRTLKIVRQLARYYKLHLPIMRAIDEVVFEGLPIEKAMHHLMRYPYSVDVDFID